jgi:hypothetical protein
MAGKQAASKSKGNLSKLEEGACRLIFMNLNDTIFLDKQIRKDVDSVKTMNQNLICLGTKILK